MGNKLSVYRLVIPTKTKKGASMTSAYFHDWCKNVARYTGNLTIVGRSFIMTKVEDSMYETTEVIFYEVTCSREQLDKILEDAIEYFFQNEITVYQISNNIINKKL